MMKNKLSQVSVFFIMFFVGITGVKADMTCKYEMVPVNYYINGKNYQPNDRHYTQVAQITYKGNSDGYTLKSTKHFDSSVPSNEFMDNNFSKNVLNDKKCPKYVKRTSKGNLSIIKEKDFKDEVNSYNGNSNKWKYPLVLVEENGKETNNVDALISATTAAWTAIRQTDQYKKDEGITELEKTYRKTMQELSCKNSVSKNTDWKTYIGKMQNESKLSTLNEQRKNATTDYCSLYCSETACKTQTNSTAKNECIKTCEKTDKKEKCNEAYSACTKVGSSNDQTECIKSKLTSAGLDPEYTTDRSKKIKDIDDQIDIVRTELKKATSPVLNVSFDSNGYKVKCSDISFLHDIWNIFWIVGPILTILFGIMDFAKATIAGDEQKMHVATKKFPKRLLATILLFLIPITISIIVNISTDSSVKDKSLINCVVSGK